MSLQPPEKTRKLQETLHAKAKGAPSYRCYLLYDKVYREDVLAHAYERCKANGGAAGVDGQNFEDIEAGGEGHPEKIREQNTRGRGRVAHAKTSDREGKLREHSLSITRGSSCSLHFANNPG